MWLYWRLFLIGLQLLGSQRRDLIFENLVLRQQLAVCERRGHRPRLESSDRRFWSLTSRRWSAWRSHLCLVQPATVVGWHRTAWRRYWRWKSRGRPPGRTRIDAETRTLITRLAEENPLSTQPRSPSSCWNTAISSWAGKTRSGVKGTRDDGRSRGERSWVSRSGC